MSFEVCVLGVGDAFSEKYHPTSFLLRAGDFNLAIDCPDQYRAVLADFRANSDFEARLDDIDDVLITHIHGDHINGLEGATFYKHFVQQKRVSLHTIPEVREVLWEGRLRCSMGTLWDGKELKALEFEEYFDYHELAWSKDNDVGPFRIKIRRTRHHVPTAALLIEHQGVRLG